VERNEWEDTLKTLTSSNLSTNQEPVSRNHLRVDAKLTLPVGLCNSSDVGSREDDDEGVRSGFDASNKLAGGDRNVRRHTAQSWGCGANEVENLAITVQWLASPALSRFLRRGGVR
jgi:hypothetical protein